MSILTPTSGRSLSEAAQIHNKEKYDEHVDNI
jgi:hypothetical protein